VLILEGLAVFDCSGESIEMEPGDITWVPPDIVHRFRNRGATTMRILWVYGRLDANRTLAGNGETSAIASERRQTTTPETT
jgi:mannose-6-phosphate isomerase-like protein (cupin superfamily)